MFYFKGNVKENIPFQRNWKGEDFGGFARDGEAGKTLYSRIFLVVIDGTRTAESCLSCWLLGE